MKQIICVLILMSSISLTAQKVGINMTIPEYTLDLRSSNNTDPSQLNISNQDKSQYIRFFSGSDAFPDPSMSWHPGYSFIFATFDDVTFDFTEYMRISHTGKIGIGKTDPLATLDIKGGDWNLDGGNPGDFRIGNATYNFRIGIATGGGGAGITRMYTNSNKLILGANNGPALALGKNRNVGIGTTDPEARLEIRSAGLGDTLILLKNALSSGDVDYGIYFDDTNSKSTIGAYYDVDSSGVIAHSDCGDCSVISGNVSSAYGIGVEGNSSDPNGTGVYGFVAEGTSEGYGIGVIGESKADFGKGMQAIGRVGVEAISVHPDGLAIRADNYSLTGETVGVQSEVFSPDGTGIIGNATNSSGGVGVRGITAGFMSNGVEGIANSLFGSGVYGKGMTNGVTGEGPRGVDGLSSVNNGVGVRGTSTGIHGVGIRGAATGGGDSYAGYFEGHVHVNGILSKSSGSFKIDHPLDPENKYLSHSFVESPDMMNIYNGNIRTDKQGNATIILPDYFEVLNMDFRYQLTVIGEFAQAIVSEKIDGNAFKIKTDKPNIEVSWQVTGVRNDAYAIKNRIPVEEDKEVENLGKYLNPEAFDKSKTMGITKDY